MRKWRVGTVSMGLSLISLGVILPISQIKGSQAFEPLLLWWPAILVVLGIEILLFLFVSKQENPVLKYDFLSILFVGVLGTVGIALTVLTSTGLLEQIQTVVGSEEATFDLPAVTEKISDDIKRVIVETGYQSVTVEGTSDKELHVFGTYRASVNQDEQPPITSVEQYTMMKTVGNTLYIYIKEPKVKNGPFSTFTNIVPTIAVPESLRLEVRGKDNQVDLHASSMGNHWLVDGASTVDVHVKEDSDMQLSARVRQSLPNPDKLWDQVEELKADADDYTQEYKGLLTLGSGTFHLDIMNSDWVELHLLENTK